MKDKLLIILGPTATGKTDLALNLAKKFNGELIAADSRQVYRGLDIGTGKLPSQVQKSKIKNQKSKGWWKIDGVKVWMYDVVSLNSQYTVADYVKDANKVVREVSNRGKLPIVVGGTGFYLKVLLEGLPNLAVPVDLKFRKQLERLSLKALQEKLRLASVKRWKQMNRSDRENPRRLVRAIELAITGKSKYDGRHKMTFNVPTETYDLNVIKIGLIAPRQILYQRVNNRVLARIDQGMIEEAKKLHAKELSLKKMRQLGLEYGVLADHLEGKIKSKEDLIEILQNKIHGYVRRQLTWFKKQENIHWFDITEIGFEGSVEKLIGSWYDQQ